MKQMPTDYRLHRMLVAGAVAVAAMTAAGCNTTAEGAAETALFVMEESPSTFAGCYAPSPQKAEGVQRLETVVLPPHRVEYGTGGGGGGC